MRLLSWFNLHRFDGEGDGDGGTDGGDAGKGEGDPGKKPPESKTFTQEELDRIVGDRLKRQKEQFAGYDDLKKKAEDWDKLQTEQLSDLEKAETARAEAEERATRRIADANERLLRGEVKGLAGALEFIDPGDAFALIDRSKVTVSDEGEVSGVEDALKELAAAKPHLVRSKRPAGEADGGARGGGDGRSSFREAPADEFKNELAKHGLRSRS